MDTPLLGLRGDMGAGKDTLAAEICAQHPGYGVRKFATALREAAEFLTDIPPERTTSDADKAVDLSGRIYGAADLRARLGRAVDHVVREPAAGLVDQMFAILSTASARPPAGMPAGVPAVTIPMTVGRLLQVLGTECFRNLVGADVWADALFLRWERDGRPPAVVADARFPNETEAIRRRGGVVVLVSRPGAARADGRAAGHASERALDGEDPDVVVDNSGPLASLGPELARVWPQVLDCARGRAG